MSKGFLKFCISNLIIGQISVSNLTNVHKKASHINYYARLHETGKRNKQTSANTIITQAYRSRCSSDPESHQVRPESLETFQPSYLSSKVKNENYVIWFGFPMTLTSGAFLNQNLNKQTSHEERKNLDSGCTSFCTSSGKRQLKTSEDDETKLCQLQPSVNKFPGLHKLSAWTQLSNFD